MGPKTLPTRAVPVRWTAEQRDQDRQRQWDDPRRELRRDDFEAFHGRQHRYRRRDHAVAVEHRRAEKPERDRRAGVPALGRQLPQHQCQQREDAAFAVIAGAQHDHHVLDRDDQRDRPEDHRQHAEDARLADARAALAADALLEGIQRAGPDVAVDHAERGQDERRRQRVRPVVCGLNSRDFRCGRWRHGVVALRQARAVLGAAQYGLDHRTREVGAGEGNRTLVCSLGSCRSAIELHPQCVEF